MTSKRTPDETAPLYHRYDRQTSPQPAFLLLSLDDGETEWGYNPEIGNAVPARVWHGIDRLYGCSALLTESQMEYLTDRLNPLIERVCSGGDVVWDGSNHVGRLDADAEAAEVEIKRILDGFVGDAVIDEEDGHVTSSRTAILTDGHEMADRRQMTDEDMASANQKAADACDGNWWWEWEDEGRTATSVNPDPPVLPSERDQMSAPYRYSAPHIGYLYHDPESLRIVSIHRGFREDVIDCLLVEAVKRWKPKARLSVDADGQILLDGEVVGYVEEDHEADTTIITVTHSDAGDNPDIDDSDIDGITAWINSSPVELSGGIGSSPIYYTCKRSNASPVVLSGGGVWVVIKGHGHWLTQDQIDAYVVWRDSKEENR